MQALYHLSHFASSFHIGYFEIGSHLMSRLASYLWSPV
jgi:hypothetical protein